MHDGDARPRQGGARFGLRCAEPGRESRPGPCGERLDFEGREAGVDWHRAPTRVPDGEQFGEELEAVAEVKEDAVARLQPGVGVRGKALCDVALGVRARPPAARQRLNQISEGALHHSRSIIANPGRHPLPVCIRSGARESDRCHERYGG